MRGGSQKEGLKTQGDKLGNRNFTQLILAIFLQE